MDGTFDKMGLKKWLHDFHELKAEADSSTWLGLNAAYGMSLIQIETLYGDTEIVYDQYLHISEDVATVFKSALKQRGACTLSFRHGIDSALLPLLGWSAMWCRCPKIRSELTNLLRTSRWKEGLAGSGIWALHVETQKLLEEEGISPPPFTCADVPKHRRIRVEKSSLYWKSQLQKMEYLRSPYTGPVEPVWFPFSQSQIQFEPSVSDSESEPDLIIGPGYAGYREGTGQYFTVRAPVFYYAIPKA